MLIKVVGRANHNIEDPPRGRLERHLWPPPVPKHKQPKSVPWERLWPIVFGNHFAHLLSTNMICLTAPPFQMLFINGESFVEDFLLVAFQYAMGPWLGLEGPTRDGAMYVCMVALVLLFNFNS